MSEMERGLFIGVSISSLNCVIIRQLTIWSAEISYSATGLSSLYSSYFIGSGSSNE